MVALCDNVDNYVSAVMLGMKKSIINLILKRTYMYIFLALISVKLWMVSVVLFLVLHNVLRPSSASRGI